MALPVRKSYKGAPVNTTLSALLGSGSTSCTVGSVTGWPTTFPFYVVIEPGTSREEKVKVTAATGTTLTITRAQDNTTDVEHPSASTVYPVFTAVEADEANQIASAMTTKGDLITTDGSSINRLAVGATNTHVLQVDSTATNGIKWGQVATAGIADSAVTSAKIADGTIVDADINAAAAIDPSKLGTGALPTTVTVASGNIVNGTITNDDINASAGIALSKLGSGALPTNITVASANIVDGSITAADTDFGGAWTAFNVTWTVGGSNATTTGSGRYLKIGRLVIAHYNVTTGSTLSNGVWFVNLPFNISGLYSTTILGNAQLKGATTTVDGISCFKNTDGTMVFYNGTGGNFSDSTNGSSYIRAIIMYEASS